MFIILSNLFISVNIFFIITNLLIILTKKNICQSFHKEMKEVSTDWKTYYFELCTWNHPTWHFLPPFEVINFLNHQRRPWQYQSNKNSNYSRYVELVNIQQPYPNFPQKITSILEDTLNQYKTGGYTKSVHKVIYNKTRKSSSIGHYNKIWGNIESVQASYYGKSQEYRHYNQNHQGLNWSNN